MRIYVRLEPLHRPVPIDVEPTTLVSELCDRLGTQALYLPSALSPVPNRWTGRGADCSEPLDGGAALCALVPAHSTLTAGTWLGRSKCTLAPPPCETLHRKSGTAGVGGGEWLLSRNPTPLVTASPAIPAALRISAGVTGSSRSETRSKSLARPADAPGSDTLSLHGSCNDTRSKATATAKQAESEPGSAVHSLGMMAADDEQVPSSNQPVVQPPAQQWPVQPPAAPAPFLIEDDKLILDDDWQDLSVVGEVDDASISSASGAWTVAGEIVDGAILAEELAGAIYSSDEELQALELEDVEAPFLPISALLPEQAACWLPIGTSIDQWNQSFVYTWGDNSSGQCLVGDSRPIVPKPERIAYAGSCTSVSCGRRCSIVVDQHGALWGGGYNARGLLAETAVTGPIWSPTRIDLSELQNADLTATAIAQEHVLAVTSAGDLVAWASSNHHGQAGVGAELMLETPVFPRAPAWPLRPQPRPPFRIAAVSCGDEHSVVLTDEGEVFVFGSSAAGQLGLGDAVKSAATPRALSSRARGLPFRAIAAGARHSLALTLTGEVFAWGDNGQGQLGLGSSRSSQAIVSVPTPTLHLPGPARRVAAGGRHSAAIVRKGRIFLAGDNSHGQLGHRHCELQSSASFTELPLPFRSDLNVRAVALGNAHSLLLTYHGYLYAFGRNSEGQCGICNAPSTQQQRDCEVSLPGCVIEEQSPSVEVPTEVRLPWHQGASCQPSVWAIAAGHSHNMVLCAPLYEEQAGSPCTRHSSFGALRQRPSSGQDGHRGRSQHRMSTVMSMSGGVRRSSVRSMRSFGKDGLTPAPSRSPVGRSGTQEEEVTDMTPALSWAPGFKDGLTSDTEGSIRPHDVALIASESPTAGGLPRYNLLRPIVQPGASMRPFSTLRINTIAMLASAAREATGSFNLQQSELGRMLLAGLAAPSVLNASFCFPGLRSIRLDAANLCKALAALCSSAEGVGQQLLDAASAGLQTLATGPMEDLAQVDQLRAIAVYLILPANRYAPGTAGGRHRSLLASIAHLVAKMSGVGRTALRDLLADECGDARVLRDFLVPHVRALAEDTIRTLGQQQWLAGQLWEVVAQLQLQRPLWEAILLLQVLASASEQAQHLLELDVRGTDEAGFGNGVASSTLAWSVSNSMPVMVGRRASSGLVDSTGFQLTALAEGLIPPEVDFWLFQEHALFHQLSPEEVVREPWWSDAAGMLPRRFCSFMAHANLVPIAFKQRVLQVENVLRQRLSQEQAMWPRVESILGGGRTDLSALYFILSVSRQNLLRDTFAQMYFASPVDLRRPLRVEFTGEEAVDEGGVMREFFRLLARELFAPDAGLFYEAEGSRRLWFCPVLGAGRQLEDYWMVGVIVALAVYNNHPGLDLPLPSALFKKLKDQQTMPEDLVQLFPSHARSLEAILNWSPSQPVESEASSRRADEEFKDAFCLSYCWSMPTVQGAAPVDAPLCEGGADRPVLYRDRDDFVSMAHDYLLHGSVQSQFESFARGFRRVCNSPLFDVLSPEELEAIVAGDTDLDFARLRQGVQYEGFSATEPYIESLWQVLEGFSIPRRRRFLAFCTGSDVAPTGGLQELHLLVQKNGEEPTMRLPVAHTCFNLLLLPMYGSIEKLRTMLVTAIEWTEGFGLQ